MAEAGFQEFRSPWLASRNDTVKCYRGSGHAVRVGKNTIRGHCDYRKQPSKYRLLRVDEHCPEREQARRSMTTSKRPRCLSYGRSESCVASLRKAAEWRRAAPFPGPARQRGCPRIEVLERNFAALCSAVTRSSARLDQEVLVMEAAQHRPGKHSNVRAQAMLGRRGGA